MTQKTRVALVVLAFMALAFFIVALARTSPAPVALKDGVYVTPFKAGSRLVLDVSSGGVEIAAGDAPELRIEYIGDPFREPRIAVKATGDGSSVNVQGLRNGARLLITLPRETSLRANMGAGELTVRDLNGNKDITLYAGRVAVIGTPAQYRGFEAKVLAGRINAPAMHLDKGGIFRWADWHGAGSASLDVMVLSGEVSVTE